MNKSYLFAYATLYHMHKGYAIYRILEKRNKEIS